MHHWTELESFIWSNYSFRNDIVFISLMLKFHLLLLLVVLLFLLIMMIFRFSVHV